MKRKQLFLSVATAVVLFFVGAALPALAQGPYCVEYDFESGLQGWSSDHGASILAGDLYLSAGEYTEIPFTGYVSGQPNQIEFWARGGGGANPQFTLYCGGTPISGPHNLGYYVVGVDYAYSTYSPSAACGTTPVIRVSESSGAVWSRFEDIHVSPYGCSLPPTPTPIPTSTPTPTATPSPPDYCLNPDPDFDESSAWQTTGVISDSIVTLGPGEYVAQNADLDGLITYQVTISITQVASATNLAVSLGSVSDVLPVTTADTYYLFLTTPDGISGPTALGLENIAGGEIEIQSACLSHSTTGPTGECIAPQNGNFTDNTGWDFYRNAYWGGPSENAQLPAPDNGLIVTSSSYTMPTLAGGEYLLMSFDAQSSNNAGGLIGYRADDDVNSSTGTLETYTGLYRYEADLSNLDGSSFVELAFANVATSTYTADILLDNVCVFVATRPAVIPRPLNTLPPIRLLANMNISGCNDIDGIWSGFGVNMPNYRAMHAAGTSLWEPSGWVPWLRSAAFSAMGDFSCMFVAAYLGLLSSIEYLLNSIANIVAWLSALSNAFMYWLHTGFQWVVYSLQTFFIWIGGWITVIVIWIENLVAWYAQNVTNVFNWIISSWSAFWSWLGGVWAAWWDWAISGLEWLWNWLWSWLDSWWQWLLEQGTVIYDIYVFIVALFAMLWLLIDFVWQHTVTYGSLPLQFYYGFDESFNSAAYNPLVSCSSTNFWCAFLAGVQLINQSIAHSILYPIVIVAIILSTIAILWRDITQLFSQSA